MNFLFAFDCTESFCKNMVPFGLVQNLEFSDLAMAKVKKVNITVTYMINDGTMYSSI